MLFSIIVPMYNVGKYARKCIESILSQSFRDFEVIIIDDGSSDNTAEIIDCYAKLDSRIIIIHKKNGGLVSARKEGALIAKGEYIVSVDGDDWIDSDYLRYTSEIISKFRPDMICYDYFVDYNNNRLINKTQYNGLKIGLNNQHEINSFCQKHLFSFSPNIAFKVIKNKLYIYHQTRVNDEISMGEDGMVTFPLLCRCNSIYISRHCYYHYRQNPLSMTKNKKNVISGSAAILRIELLENEIKEFPTKCEQISAYCTHAITNVSLSYFRNYQYIEAKNKTEILLRNKLINKYMRINPKRGSKKEKVCHYLLRHRMFLILKALSFY